MKSKPLTQETSVRDFIRHSFQELQERVPTLTLESFADRLGVGRSSLKMIVSGQRKATAHQILCLGRALRLSAPEIHYLQLLSMSEGAENSWEKAYYSGLLKKLRSALKTKSKITADGALLENPAIQPILVLLADSQRPLNAETFKWVAKKLSIQVSAVEKAVDKLKKSGLLEGCSDGNVHIRFDRLTNKGEQKQFIKNSLLQTARRIEKDYDREQTLFVNYTFSTTDQSLAQLQIELKNLMEKFLLDSPPADEAQVASASFQVFPYSLADSAK